MTLFTQPIYLSNHLIEVCNDLRVTAAEGQQSCSEQMFGAVSHTNPNFNYTHLVRRSYYYTRGPWWCYNPIVLFRRDEPVNQILVEDWNSFMKLSGNRATGLGEVVYKFLFFFIFRSCSHLVQQSEPILAIVIQEHLGKGKLNHWPRRRCRLKIFETSGGNFVQPSVNI